MQVNNGGGRGGYGWVVNGSWGRELVLVNGRCYFCQGSKASEGVEGIEHCACCVGGELWKTSYLHCTQVSEFISCVNMYFNFNFELGRWRFGGEGTVAY